MDARRERRALHHIVLRLVEQNRQLRALLTETTNREALEHLQIGLERLDDEHKLHAAEVSRLRAAGQKLNADLGPILKECDESLANVRGVRDRLQELERQLKADRERVEGSDALGKRDAVSALIEKAKLHLAEAEYDQAIETYRQIMNETGERADIRKKLEELEEAWKPKGPEHEGARRFAYSVWPKIVNFEDVRTQLPEARQQFEVCKSQGDRLTTKKLYLVATRQATTILLDEFENVKKSDSDVLPLMNRQLEKAIMN